MDGQLYSTRDAARIFSLTESRLLYWARTGVVGPSVRRGGRSYYTFQDLITVKTAKELIDGGLSLQAVRKNLTALRTALPGVDRPLAQLRVVSDGERLLVVGEDVTFEPLSGQVVMDFAVGALWSQVARITELPARGAQADDPKSPATAYGWFQLGAELDEDPEKEKEAEAAYRRAIGLDPALAAAHTNLGNLMHRQGHRGEAREFYEKALALDPEQPEARYNLANLLDELGDTDLAVAELRAVCSRHPSFADAHYNLGLLLFRLGGVAQARHHLGQYLAIDPASDWASRARALLDS
jgi:tetratricopeptide (TPR) repeat protein